MTILKNLIPALDNDSRILIDEVVLPDQGVPWQATGMDLTMMACLGALERTREQWNTLLESSGLKILDVHVHDSALCNSVIVAVPK